MRTLTLEMVDPSTTKTKVRCYRLDRGQGTPDSDDFPISKKCFFSDEYKHGFAVPESHTHKSPSTARPGVQSTPDS